MKPKINGASPQRKHTRVTLEDLRIAYETGTPLTKAQRKKALKLYQKMCDTLNGYIAPHIKQTYIRKEYPYDQYNIHYTIEGEYEEDNIEVRILTDTTNPTPDIVKWCAEHQRSLKSEATETEIIMKRLLRNIKGITFTFQKPFIVCDKVFYADFYIPSSRTIIEIDGGYHSTQSQILKDTKRTAYLNSVGVKVVRLTDKEVLNDDIKIYEILAPLVQLKKGKTISPEKLKEQVLLQQKQFEKKRIEAAAKAEICSRITMVGDVKNAKCSKIRWIEGLYLGKIKRISRYESIFSNTLKECGVEVNNKTPLLYGDEFYIADIYLPQYRIAIDIIKYKADANPFEDSTLSDKLKDIDVRYFRIYNFNACDTDYVREFAYALSRVDESSVL